MDRVVGMGITISKYQPFRGSSYYVELPKYISAKKACINVNNQDEKCIMWAILAALFPAKFI